MTEVLAGPFAIAALVAGIAGAAKLRAPATAARALATLGVPGGRALVRVIALLELMLAGWCLVVPGRGPTLALAGAYAGFTVVAALLARRQESCGCFGADDGPVSALHGWLSLLLALVVAAAAVWPPARIASVALWVGAAGAAYAIVLAYTELPAAWRAWEGR